jgi:hypothetical protein
MPTAGFETAIPASERPETYVLDGAATQIGKYSYSTLLGAFAKLQRETISLLCSSAHPHRTSRAPAGKIFVKLGI